MTNIIAKESNENNTLCTPCGGECCKAMSGVNLPEDFDNNFENVKEALVSGKYAIDCWDFYDGAGSGYFIRPSTKGKEGEITDWSWGGECTFLTSKGCSLSSQTRPWGCRQLTPAPEFKCSYPFETNPKYLAAQQWEPFYAQLQEFINEND